MTNALKHTTGCTSPAGIMQDGLIVALNKAVMTADAQVEQYKLDAEREKGRCDELRTQLDEKKAAEADAVKQAREATDELAKLKEKNQKGKWDSHSPCDSSG